LEPAVKTVPKKNTDFGGYPFLDVLIRITFQDQKEPKKCGDLEIGSPDRQPLIFRGELLVSGRVCFLVIVFYFFFL